MMRVGALSMFTTVQQPMTQGRNGSIDLLRLVAALGIVDFHLGGRLAAIGYAGLPVFAALMGYNAIRRTGTEKGRQALVAQARQLALLWLVWSAIYGALKVAEVVAARHSPADEFAAWMLLTGPAIHLWFLPFAALTLLGLRHAGRWLTPGSEAGFVRGAGLAAAVSLAAFGLSAQPGLPIPLPQWLYVAPALAFGLLLALAGDDRRRQAIWLVSVAATVLLCSRFGPPGAAFTLLLALSAIGLAMALRLPQTPVSDLARRLSMAIYLLHPMMVAVLLRLTHWPSGSAPMLPAVLLGTGGLALLLLRSPLRRWAG